MNEHFLSRLEEYNSFDVKLESYRFLPVLGQVYSDESLHNLLISVATLSKEVMKKFMSDYYDPVCKDKVFKQK